MELSRDRKSEMEETVNQKENVKQKWNPKIVSDGAAARPLRELSRVLVHMNTYLIHGVPRPDDMRKRISVVGSFRVSVEQIVDSTRIPFMLEN
jgi:hypothetical protein